MLYLPSMEPTTSLATQQAVVVGAIYASRNGSLLASNSALLLQYITYDELVNCSFHDNLGSGLTVRNTNITLTNIKFTYNHCGCKSFSESFSEGCID